MKRFISHSTLAGSLLALAIPLSYAGEHKPGLGQEQDQDQTEDFANVLVVKVKDLGDMPQQQQQEEQQDQDQGLIPVEQQDQDQGAQQEAYMIPLNIEIPRLKDGSVDYEKLATICDEAEANGVSFAMSDSSSLADTAPEGVASIFQEAEHEDLDKQRVRWRVWSPWGTVGNSGYYGYGYRPYYRHYNRNYSRYGYYNGYRSYPYRYGYHRYNRGWNRYYYHR